jgi:methanogenic corrinoid protein MtbC1
MRTVSQEMSAEERRERLIKSLTACGDQEAVINFSHLAHAIGMDNAERLISNLVAMSGLVTTPFSRKPEYVSHGMCVVDPIIVIEEIRRVQTKTEKNKIDKLLKRNTP